MKKVLYRFFYPLMDWLLRPDNTPPDTSPRSRRRRKESPVMDKVMSIMLASHYLNCWDVADRADISPKAASYCLAYCFDVGLIERIKRKAEIPAKFKWSNRHRKNVWHYRIKRPEIVVTLAPTPMTEADLEVAKAT